MIGAIFWETRPAMIIRSDCRGEPRKTSAPKREMSKRDALIDIISIAQQASPKVIGQIDDLRAQLTAISSVVNRTPSASITSSYQITGQITGARSRWFPIYSNHQFAIHA